MIRALTREVNLATESSAERRESVSEFQSLIVVDGGQSVRGCVIVVLFGRRHA